MDAVVELASSEEGKELGEMVIECFLLEVYKTEALDSWGVDDESAARNDEHFGKGRGVSALRV